MIQGITNSSKNQDSIQGLSFQVFKSTEKLPESGGLSALSSSTQDIILKETLNLIKGVTIDLLRAALESLTRMPNTPNNTTPNLESDTAAPEQNTTEPATNITGSPVDAAETTPPRKNESLSSFLQRELQPNAEGNFHEEQLQYGIVSYLLNEKSPDLFQQFKTSYSEYKSGAGSRASYEDGVKAALKSLVAAKKLSKSEAEDINGKSFRAAQLDKDTSTLFDDKGGPGDNTVAAMNAKEAADKVDRAYGRIRREETNAPARSLDAPSNTKGSNGVSVRTSSTGARNGFLWKPVSESDSKLAILAPSSISEEVESISIYKKDSNGKKTLIESGRASGSTEGRAVFRFKQAGGQYPDGAVVEIKLKNGEIVSEVISETSSRVEK